MLIVVPMEVMTRYHDAALPPEITGLALDPFSINLPYEVWQPVLAVAYAAVVVSLVVPFAVTVHRYRAASADRRAQIRWLMWAALVDMFVLLIPLENPPVVSNLLFGLSIALTSAAIVIAVTKHRLYAVDRLLSATFLYGVLALLVVAVDLAVFAVAGGVLGERDAALAAIAVVAVIYAPLRSRLWRAVRRLVRGSRDDPYATVSALAERLESAADPGRATARGGSDLGRGVPAALCAGGDRAVERPVGDRRAWPPVRPDHRPAGRLSGFVCRQAGDLPGRWNGLVRAGPTAAG